MDYCPCPCENCSQEGKHNYDGSSELVPYAGSSQLLCPHAVLSGFSSPGESVAMFLSEGPSAELGLSDFHTLGPYTSEIPSFPSSLLLVLDPTFTAGSKTIWGI